MRQVGLWSPSNGHMQLFKSNYDSQISSLISSHLYVMYVNVLSTDKCQHLDAHILRTAVYSMNFALLRFRCDSALTAKSSKTRR
jgi:predicted nucleic acid-binding protein